MAIFTKLQFKKEKDIKQFCSQNSCSVKVSGEVKSFEGKPKYSDTMY